MSIKIPKKKMSNSANEIGELEVASASKVRNALVSNILQDVAGENRLKNRTQMNSCL
jgi:hypothetical protein